MSRRSRRARRAAQRRKVQKRFKARVAAGKSGLTGGAKGTKTNQAKRGQPDTSTIGKYRAAQRARVSSAAEARNKTFQAARIGLDSQKLGAEATRLTGIPSGADLKPGMLTFSKEGIAQAEANKKEAARKSTFDSRRLYGMNKSPFTGLKGLETFKNFGYRAPVYKPANQMRFGIPYNDPGRTGTLGNFGNWFDKGVNKRIGNEARIGFGTALSDDFSQMGKFKNVRTGKLESGLFGTGIPKNFNQLKQTFQGEGGFGFSFGKGADTGPTGIQRMGVRRILPYVGQISLGQDIFNYGGSKELENFADNTIGKINPYAGTTDQSPELNAAAAARERGPLLSIGGFKIPEFGVSEFMGINAVDRTPNNVKVASTDAGGLNIGTKEATTKGDPTGRSLFSIGKGIADFAFNDRTDLDNLGKGLFGKGIVTPQDVKSDIKTSIKKIGPMETLAQGIEGFRDYNRIKDADNKALAFAENVNADQFAKALSFAEDSKAVQKAGENLGTLFNQKNVNLPSDFKAQIKNVVKGIQEETGGIEQGKVNNRFTTKNRVDAINNLLANVNQNPNLSTLSKIAGRFDPSTNPDAANMTSLQKIAAGFNPESPNVKALSFSDRGIVGSAGNLLVGGKLSDIYRQATGNIEGGANANIPTGQVGLSNADMFNIATSAIKNVNTKGSLSQQRLNEIRSLAGDKGITPTSLIKGVLPQFQRRTGGGNQTRSTSGGNATQQQLIEELLINQTPTTTTTTPTQTVGNAGNLQNLQQQAYLRALASYGFNPNYFAQVRPRKLATAKPKSFSDYFRR